MFKTTPLITFKQTRSRNQIPIYSFFNSYSFTYSHDASIRAVAKKFVAGAAIDSLAYDYLLKYRPQIASKIRIIEILPPRGTGPIVARKGLIDEKKMQKILQVGVVVVCLFGYVRYLILFDGGALMPYSSYLFKGISIFAK